MLNKELNSYFTLENIFIDNEFEFYQNSLFSLTLELLREPKCDKYDTSCDNWIGETEWRAPEAESDSPQEIKWRAHHKKMKAHCLLLLSSVLVSPVTSCFLPKIL